VIDLMDHYNVDKISLYFKYISGLPSVTMSISGVCSESGERVFLRR
jgi:hypothetical protein